MAAAIRRYDPHTVLLVARGTSDHAALYAKYLVEIRLGKGGRSGFAVDHDRLRRPARLPRRAHARRQPVGWLTGPRAVDRGGPRLPGALTVAVTNDAASDLARAATAHVDVLAGPGLAVAATKTYTAQLLALPAARPGAAAPAARTPGARPRRRSARSRRRDRALASRYRFAQRMVTTGRGYSYPTAREAALKLMETAYLSAQAFSAADLLHGPLAMIDPQVPVLAVVADGIGGRAMAPVLPRLAERGADVCVVGSAAAGGARGAAPGVPEELSPLLEILPFQLLALHVAVERGGDPDAPRGLAKVTETL